MTEQLSRFRIKRGRRIFDSYSAINSFSFALVTGNTVTLYALALGANSTVVGLLSAFMYFAFFAIPLGKLGLRRSTLVKTFANNWMFRNWSLIPLLVIPYLWSNGHSRSSLMVLVIGVFFFNLFRGIGLIANNPVIGLLAPGKDRGEYIVRVSLINNGTALIATVFLALLLWKDSGIETYNLVVLIGIVTGVIASVLLYKLPEPGDQTGGEAEPAGRASSPGAGAAAPRGRSLASSFLEAMREPNFRLFILSYLVVGFGIGMVRPFIIVFCKEVYGQKDSIVTVFTMCSSLGALGMGVVMRLVIDRLGAKPMYIIFTAVSLISLVPALIAPGIGAGLFAVAFLCVLSAVTNMGFAGQENAAQTYFFAMVPKESIMDLSVLYYFILGGTGAIGSILGGTVLDGLSALGLSALASYRLFFLACLLVIAAGVRIQRRLLDLGSYAVRDTLAILLSPRDMRALTLLRKLDANENPDEEAGIIAELGEVASDVSAGGLIDRLSSPRFAVRYEALQSVSALERLNGKTREALLRELDTGAFATAALAARLLGQFGVSQAITPLRAALDSPDYRLAGEAMLALARLRDPRSQFPVSERLSATDNPFILVRGVQAMAEFGNAASLPILLDLLRSERLPAHVSDETILTIGDLMGVPKKFYYAYDTYVRDRKRMVPLLHDALDETFARRKRRDEELLRALTDYARDPSIDSAFVRWVLDFGRGHTGINSALLVSVALDTDLKRQEAFRFFLCFWAASVFADPSLIEK